MKTLFISFAVFSLMASTSFADGHAHKGHHKALKKNYFSSMDIDENGGVSMDEFIKKHKSMFSKIDTDANGELSPEEFKNHHKKKAHRKASKRMTSASE